MIPKGAWPLLRDLLFKFHPLYISDIDIDKYYNDYTHWTSTGLPSRTPVRLCVMF